MSEKKSSSSISFCELLAITFIVLKLTKVIGWSWLWVLSPLWMPVALSVVILIFYFIFKFITDYLPDHFENKKRLNNSWIEKQALERKDSWRAGIPEKENCCTVFKVNGKWHNGYYENGAFRIIGTDSYFQTVDVWYYA